MRSVTCERAPCCTLTFALWIGNRFMAAEHGARTRREVLALTLAALMRDP